MFLVLGRQGEPDELEQSEDQERSDENTSRSENSEVRKKSMANPVQDPIRPDLNTRKKIYSKKKDPDSNLLPEPVE